VKRVKSNFSWTELRVRSLRIRIILFAVIGVIFLAEGGLSTVGVISDIIGILIGAILGLIGSVMTSFEQREAGLYLDREPCYCVVHRTLWVSLLYDVRGWAQYAEHELCFLWKLVDLWAHPYHVCLLHRFLFLAYAPSGTCCIEGNKIKQNPSYQARQDQTLGTFRSRCGHDSPRSCRTSHHCCSK
jgi:hypothetical protein